MNQFAERASLIPNSCLTILDWPAVEKEHKGFGALVELVKSGNVSLLDTFLLIPVTTLIEAQDYICEYAIAYLRFSG